MSKLSNSPILPTLAYIFSVCSFAFGFNALFNRAFALSFFGFDYPALNEPHKPLVDALMLVYGVRDIYMGIALWVAAYYKHPKVIGWLTMATGGIAVSDGAICWFVSGRGYWDHWGLSPVIFIIAAANLGWFNGANS